MEWLPVLLPFVCCKILHFFQNSAGDWVPEKYLPPVSFAVRKCIKSKKIQMLSFHTFYGLKRGVRQIFLRYPIPCALLEKMKNLTFSSLKCHDKSKNLCVDAYFFNIFTFYTF